MHHERVAVVAARGELDDVVGELDLVWLDGRGEGASQLLWRINGLTG